MFGKSRRDTGPEPRSSRSRTQVTGKSQITRSRFLTFEQLEPRVVLSTQPTITRLLASELYNWYPVQQVASQPAASLSDSSVSAAVTTVGPTVSMVPVSPALRNTPVASVTIQFNESIYGFTKAALQLTLNGNPVSLSSATLTNNNTGPPSLRHTTWMLGNLTGITGAPGTYVLSLTAAGSGIRDKYGNLLTSDASDTWVVDTTPPTATFAAVSPDPRSTAVSQIALGFSKPVSGVGVADFQLTCNGYAVSLAGATLSSSDNVNWTLGNLTGATGAPGTYVLSLTAAGSGIKDSYGNLLATNASNTWSMTTAQVTAAITGMPTSGHSPEGTPISLGSAVTDPNESGTPALTYAWSVTKNGMSFATSNTANFSFTPDDEGTYAVSLAVTDEYGDSGNDSQTITADDVAPTVAITGVPASGQSPTGTAISLGSSVTDPSPADTAAGFTYAWTVTDNGAPYATGTAANAANFTFTPSSAGTYVVALAVTDQDRATVSNNQTIAVVSNATPASSILLPAAELTALRQAAANNTAQWQAFKSRLDQNLTVILNEGDYQGSELTWISDYALGYQVLKDSDPVTASSYADKAIALMKSALNDYQKGGWEARQFLARGDGTTTTFTLPNADLLPSTLRVYVGSVSTQAVVHGAANGQDSVGYYQKYLKVSNTLDGTPNYVDGTDWSHNPSLPNNQIDWSPPGSEPAPGATYYVTTTSPVGATQVAYTLSGNTITLASPLRSDQAVFVEYVYGTHSADGSTLAYQQTSAGDGGFNSIMIDSTYTSRYLGQYVALGLDWLDGYAGFSPALKSAAMSMLVRWSDYVRDNGYYATSPASNYGAGGYASRVMTALALANRDPVNGPRLVSEVLAYRQNYVLPLLQNPTTSLKGGFWAEGWNYGQLAAENILLSGLALEQAGLIPAASAERQWASSVITNLLSAQPTAGTVFDGGDGYKYPAPFPGKSLIEVLGAMADDPAARSYANYVLQNYAGTTGNDSVDLLFRNPSAAAAFWSALPLQNFAPGTGLLTARSDWGSNPNWMAVQFGNLLNCDHQSGAPGMIEIQRGADQLLVNGNAVGGNQNPDTKSIYSNTLVVDDNGTGTQNYRYAMGFWYGTPGVTVNAYEATSNYTYIYGDYHAAYSLNTNPGGGGTTSELTRQVVYLNPNYVVVYDRVTTVQANDSKQLRWTFLNAPTISGNSFVETVGSSKLFGQTFSTAGLTTTEVPAQVGSATVQQVITQNASATASVRYVTAFQIAPSSTATMVSSQQILSTDSRMEGVQMGNQVVLFGRNGNVDLSTAVSYQVNGTGTIQQLLTNLTPGQAYKVWAGGVLVTTVTASSQGTISFSTTAAGTQTIQVST